MKTTLVAHLALAGLMVGTLGPTTLAQESDAEEGGRSFRRPRAQAPAVPRARSSEADTPKLGVLVDVKDDGIVITEVSDGSMAAAAGLQAGDILLTLNGRRLDEIDDIRSELGSTKPGEKLVIGVIREGEGLVKLDVAMHGGEKKEPRGRADRHSAADGHRGGFLGVQLGEATDSGVIVDGVVDNSAAWFAGLEEGDRLHSFNGEKVRSGEDVVGCVSECAPGTMVTLGFSRDGTNHDSRIRIGSRNTVPSALGSFMRPQGNAVFPGTGRFTVPSGVKVGPGGNVFFGSDDEDGEGYSWFGVNDEDGPFQIFQGDDGEFDVRVFGGEDGVFDVSVFGDDEDGAGAFLFHDGEGAWFDSEAFEGLHELEDLKSLGFKGFKGLKGLDGLKGLEGLKALHLDDIEGLDLEGAHTLKIKIENGVLTLDKDGEVQVIELGPDEDGVERIYEYHMERSGDRDDFEVEEDTPRVRKVSFDAADATLAAAAEAECTEAASAECEAARAECEAALAECEEAELIECCEQVYEACCAEGTQESTQENADVN